MTDIGWAQDTCSQTMPSSNEIIQAEKIAPIIEDKPACNPEPDIAPVELPTTTSTTEETVGETANTVEEEINYSYKPFWKNKEKKLPTRPFNTLNLNTDAQDIFLKVFGLREYDSINLRALVNLTLDFGAEIDTTGANRCRIKIKNIYAYIVAPQEALTRACNTASIIMHGGGHRGTRSQNNDPENTPQYLIDQFRNAFTRAGFTPVNLGLDNINDDCPSANLAPK